MEQDRKPRNELMHLWGPYFLAEKARIYNGTKTASSKNGTGTTGQLHVKEIRTLPNTIHKDKPRMD